jgi:hypothetical protein
MTMFDTPEPEAAPAEKVEKEKPEVDVATLLAKIEGLEAQVRDSAYRRSAAPEKKDDLPAIPELDLATGLPDPKTHPAEYHQEIARRTRAHAELERERERRMADQQRAEAGRVSGLWEDFKAQYPDIAEDTRKVKFLAGEVIAAAEARGLDRSAYMYGGQFLKDLAAEYKKEFGEDETEDEDDDLSDDGRTTGILGGNESGNSASSGRKDPRQSERPSMFDDLKVMQKKSGYF